MEVRRTVKLDVTDSDAELQGETDDAVRAETRLQANLIQNARDKAADAVQSVVARWKQGDYAGKPHFSAPTLAYDRRCAYLGRTGESRVHLPTVRQVWVHSRGQPFNR